MSQPNWLKRWALVPHDNPSHCMLQISFIWLLFLAFMVNIRFEYANKQSRHISNTFILLFSLLENTIIFKAECWYNKKVQLECDCLPLLYVSPEVYCFKLCYFMIFVRPVACILCLLFRVYGADDTQGISRVTSSFSSVLNYPCIKNVTKNSIYFQA